MVACQATNDMAQAHVSIDSTFHGAACDMKEPQRSRAELGVLQSRGA